MFLLQYTVSPLYISHSQRTLFATVGSTLVHRAPARDIHNIPTPLSGSGFSTPCALPHPIHGSLAQPLLPDSPGKNGTAGDKHDANVQRRSGSLAVALADDFLQMGLQAAIVRETRAHALCDFLRVFVAAESGLEAGAQGLVEGCCAHGYAEDGAEGAEEVAARCCDGLVGVRCVCDYGVLAGLIYRDGLVDLLRPISVVVTPMPFENAHTHVPRTMMGRFRVMVPAKRRTIERPMVRLE